MSESLERRVRMLEDRLEIIELEACYARFFDERDGEAWSSLFTSDGVYRSRSYGGAPPATHVTGTSALAEFCRSAPFVGLHLLHLPQLTFDEDSAQGRIHLDFHGSWSDEPGQPRLALHGFYDVAYRRVDGRWLIADRMTSAFSREQHTVLGYPPAN